MVSNSAPIKSAASAVREWIERFLIAHPPRAKSLVMTLVGDAITPHGGQLWLGSLIELLAPFGIGERLVRTSVFRLVDEGWLVARRSGRRSRYGLDPGAASRIERAHQRVYTPSDPSWDGRWTLVLATAAAITTPQRTALRAELLWEGFGTIAPAIYCHPRAPATIVGELIHRLGLGTTVIGCIATDASPVAGRPLRDLVGQGWQLDAIAAQYQQFTTRFSALPTLLAIPGSTDPAQAFVLRTLAIHEFRRVQLHDPQLPLALLPSTWPGQIAYDLCRRIYRATHTAAQAHVLATLRREDPGAPAAAAFFYQRFGALT